MVELLVFFVSPHISPILFHKIAFLWFWLDHSVHKYINMSKEFCEKVEVESMFSFEEERRLLHRYFFRESVLTCVVTRLLWNFIVIQKEFIPNPIKAFFYSL